MKVEIVLLLKNGGMVSKNVVMPFIPQPGTGLDLILNNSSISVVVENICWSERRNQTTIQVKFSTPNDTSVAYFESDSNWKIN